MNIDAFDSDGEIESVLEQLHSLDIANEWIERRRHKLLFHIGQYAEKQQAWSLAHTVYATSSYPGARQRRIRVLEKMGESTAAPASPFLGYFFCEAKKVTSCRVTPDR